jgi:hypothetical protein
LRETAANASMISALQLYGYSNIVVVIIVKGRVITGGAAAVIKEER